jgi:hypothetical protein
MAEPHLDTTKRLKLFYPKSHQIIFYARMNFTLSKSPSPSKSLYTTSCWEQELSPSTRNGSKTFKILLSDLQVDITYYPKEKISVH